MAKTIRRGRGHYSDFRVGKRRIRRFLSTDKREAQIKLGKLLEEMRGEASGQPSREISWSAFRKRYEESAHGSKKKSTRTRDKYAFDAFEADYPTIDKLIKITPEVLELWKARRLKEGMGKPTINRDLCSMKAMLHKAEAWGYLDKRNWASVKDIKTTRKEALLSHPRAARSPPGAL